MIDDLYFNEEQTLLCEFMNIFYKIMAKAFQNA
jgi:hypothetical protein